MKVNGNEMELTRRMTVGDLIAESGRKQDRVAVELNGKIVPKAEYPFVVLKDSDSVEIVGFVGGG